MKALSSNSYSHDDQVADVVSFLSQHDDTGLQALMQDKFLAEFPEYNRLTWSGSWVDHEASGVDPDYMSWVTDWLEEHTPVTWDEGEPWMADEYHLCRECGHPMHEWAESRGEPGMHWRCDCGTTLFVLTDSGDDEEEGE